MYTVTCLQDNTTSQETDTKQVVFPVTGIRVVDEDEGNSDGSLDVPVELTLINIRGESLSGIGVGRSICLKASPTNDSIDLAGFRPVNCVARGVTNGVPTGEQYEILRAGIVPMRAGCGDGFVIDATDGFTTSGNVVISPPFPFFQIGYADSLTYSCTFSFCSSPCDGNSCADNESNL
ncbi:hypothetical protein ScPMuIL_012831 [Solemya velum]